MPPATSRTVTLPKPGFRCAAAPIWRPPLLPAVTKEIPG